MCRWAVWGSPAADLRYRVEPGDFTFTVGDFSETVTLTGDVTFPERNALPAVTCETAPGRTLDERDTIGSRLP